MSVHVCVFACYHFSTFHHHFRVSEGLMPNAGLSAPCPPSLNVEMPISISIPLFSHLCLSSWALVSLCQSSGQSLPSKQPMIFRHCTRSFQSNGRLISAVSMATRIGPTSVTSASRGEKKRKTPAVSSKHATSGATRDENKFSNNLNKLPVLKHERVHSQTLMGFTEKVAN